MQAAGERRAPRGGSAGAAGLDPGRDRLWVGTGHATQLRGLPLERLVGFPSPAPSRTPATSARKVAAPGRELAEFGQCGGFLGPGEFPPPGVMSRCARELGDQDPVRVRPRSILIHPDRIEL